MTGNFFCTAHKRHNANIFNPRVKAAVAPSAIKFMNARNNFCLTKLKLPVVSAMAGNFFCTTHKLHNAHIFNPRVKVAVAPSAIKFVNARNNFCSAKLKLPVSTMAGNFFVP